MRGGSGPEPPGSTREAMQLGGGQGAGEGGSPGGVMMLSAGSLLAGGESPPSVAGGGGGIQNTRGLLARPTLFCSGQAGRQAGGRAGRQAGRQGGRQRQQGQRAAGLASGRRLVSTVDGAKPAGRYHPPKPPTLPNPRPLPCTLRTGAPPPPWLPTHRVRHQLVHLAAGAVDGQDDGEHQEGDNHEQLKACRPGKKERKKERRERKERRTGRGEEAGDGCWRAGTMVGRARNTGGPASDAGTAESKRGAEGSSAKANSGTRERCRQPPHPPMRRILRYIAASMPAQRITSASLIHSTCTGEGGGAGRSRETSAAG